MHDGPSIDQPFKPHRRIRGHDHPRRFSRKHRARHSEFFYLGVECTARDKRAVKQILLNLLSNAVKFTPESGKISVSAKTSQRSVNIMIEDNGIGISKAALKRLGQPFEQVQDQFTKNHKGSGLGLAIAKSLAVLHGGTLKIRSTVGKGTIVIVRLPLKSTAPVNVEAEQDELKQAVA